MIVKRTSIALITMGILSVMTVAEGASTPSGYDHVVVARNCLLTKTTPNIQPLSQSHSLSLLATNDAGIEQLIAAKQATGTACGGFMDVTEDWQNYHGAKGWEKQQTANQFLEQHIKDILKANAKKEKAPHQLKIQYQNQVHEVLRKMNPQSMWDNLTTLTNFKDRYARSDTGVEAAKWIKTQIEKMAADYGCNDVTAYFVKTGNMYKQPSLVVKFGNQEGPGIVLGAHMDTLSGAYSKKPGADDDGSGTVTVLEIARTLFASNLHFKKPIYFIWYAAEEEGLVGSGFVVKDFKNKNIAVDAVIHFDMTGFSYKNDPTLWLLSDYTSGNLSKYLETLINTYVKKPVKYTRCGYACSDHATWNKNGYEAAIPFEAKFGTENQNIHSSRDTMELLSLSHMTSFAQAGVAFAVELAEPTA